MVYAKTNQPQITDIQTYSKSTYMTYQKHTSSTSNVDAATEATLSFTELQQGQVLSFLEQVKSHHQRHGGVFGSPRIAALRPLARSIALLRDHTSPSLDSHRCGNNTVSVH